MKGEYQCDLCEKIIKYASQTHTFEAPETEYMLCKKCSRKLENEYLKLKK